MFDARLLIKLVRMSRKTPSRNKIIAVCVAAAVIVILVGIERFVGWPEVLTVNP